ncbi:MAG TPA: DUF998 domain-containing protein [Anaerolineales bacterium]|nr:DUF998 domain-containing protein [Anaerolineales bacterium]
MSTSTNQVTSNVNDRTGSTVAISGPAAWISFAASIASLVFLAVLHLLSPEFSPSSRMVSEYALGSYGWVLLLMFLTWALSCIALFFAIKSHVMTVGGKIGLGFLLLAAVGMTMGGLFDVNHDLHGLAAMIGMPSLPIAAVLISVSLGRNPSWTSAWRALIWTAILTWVSLVLMNIAIFTGFSPTGEANPGAWFGWANRFLIIAYDIWLLVVAWRALHMQQPRSS